MPQLDGLRAFAVGAVLLHHFFRLPRIGGVDFALLGVWLFFVLSGFLITGILLRARDQVDYGGSPSGFVLRQFYIRRFLRIFPLTIRYSLWRQRLIWATCVTRSSGI